MAGITLGTFVPAGGHLRGTDMASGRWRLGLTGAVLLAALIGRAAEGPPGGEAKMPREPEKAGAADETKPAAGTVTLTLKEYQDLLDKVARLEGSARAEPPSSCKTTARVSGDMARLHVESGSRTAPRPPRVAPGRPQGDPTDAKLDGHFPA